MATKPDEPCEECGLPMVECNALSLARGEVETYLRQNGYAAFRARGAATRLIPEVKRQTFICGSCGVKTGERHTTRCLLAGDMMT